MSLGLHTIATSANASLSPQSQGAVRTMTARELRTQFPLLRAPGAFLDNASTTQKPLVVIERMNHFYRAENANVHRGVYRLSEEATVAFEGARATAARFINAAKPAEIVFTSGTTGAINLVASSWCEAFLEEGDEILLAISEHHSNIVPWQLAAARAKAKVVFIPLDARFRLDLEAARGLVNERTRVVAIGHVSNVLGVVHPVAELIALAKGVGAITVIDGAQAVPHMSVDVQALDCDFYAFSGHKIMGPTGIGVLYGKSHWLEAIPPYQGGGGMICMVTTSGSSYAPAPEKFEAGTPNIVGALGLATAIDFLQGLPLADLAEQQYALGAYLYERLSANPKVTLFAAPGDDWTGIVPMAHTDVHPHDLAAIADSLNVAVRAGHHCAQPLMRVLGVGSTTRISPYLYNTREDIDLFLEALSRAEKLFA